MNVGDINRIQEDIDFENEKEDKVKGLSPKAKQLVDDLTMKVTNATVGVYGYIRSKSSPVEMQKAKDRAIDAKIALERYIEELESR